MFLNTKGKNEDEFVKQLQESIQKIKNSREMGERFMIFQEMLWEERTEGKIEGKLENAREYIFELLGELGSVPLELREKIEQEKDMSVLKEYHRKAARASSIDQFTKEIL